MVEVTSIWCCPICKGTLEAQVEEFGCVTCDARYPVLAGLPDFRVDQPAWIEFGADRDRALKIDEIIRRDGLEAGVLDVFRSSRKFDERKSQFRMKQVFSGITKCDRQIDDWLAPIIAEPVLEVGSGPGQLIVAAARRGLDVAAIDVSMEWLMVSKYWAESFGAQPQLACAMAEQLPVRTASIGSVISMDVIEHVGDQSAYMSEIDRVLRPEGKFALVTPNRFSMSPEPHVGVWGVGYLPVGLQAKWVKLASGQQYDFTRLLSTGEARRLARHTAGIEVDITFPKISDEEIALFSPFKARLARFYNRITGSALFAPLMPFFGAYYRISGTKSVATPPR